MNLRYCLTLTAILIIIFSLATVAASENITDLSSPDDGTSQVLVSENSNDDVDLAISVDAKPSYENNRYNKVGSEAPWTVTVSANGGTARNTQILEMFSNNLGYVSHNSTRGTYSPTTGIWTVGDLKNEESASLTIVTKLKSMGTYVNKVYATTDSNDADLLNNFIITSMRTGSSKVTSNITETTDDRFENEHNVHQASMGVSRFILREDKKQEEDDPDPTPKPDPTPTPKTSPYRPGNTPAQSTISKSILTDTPLNSEYQEILKSMQAYDYTQIPILIFALFLILLVASAGYDKIKSQ